VIGDELGGLALFVLSLLDGSRDADAIGAAIADAGRQFSKNSLRFGRFYCGIFATGLRNRAQSSEMADKTAAPSVPCHGAIG
jgi:hypothetical protein